MWGNVVVTKGAALTMADGCIEARASKKDRAAAVLLEIDFGIEAFMSERRRGSNALDDFRDSHDFVAPGFQSACWGRPDPFAAGDRAGGFNL
jgi:hypothetical protein